jgi:hypothetical protein
VWIQHKRLRTVYCTVLDLICTPCDDEIAKRLLRWILAQSYARTAITSTGGMFARKKVCVPRSETQTMVRKYKQPHQLKTTEKILATLKKMITGPCTQLDTLLCARSGFSEWLSMCAPFPFPKIFRVIFWVQYKLYRYSKYCAV